MMIYNGSVYLSVLKKCCCCFNYYLIQQCGIECHKLVAPTWIMKSTKSLCHWLSETKLHEPLGPLFGETAFTKWKKTGALFNHFLSSSLYFDAKTVSFHVIFCIKFTVPTFPWAPNEPQPSTKTQLVQKRMKLRENLPKKKKKSSDRPCQEGLQQK